MISERTFVTNFASFWHELLPLLNPRFVALFNEAYETTLELESGHPLKSIPIPIEVERSDIVAEFAFRLARLAFIHNIKFDQCCSNELEISEAEKESAVLIQRYEGKEGSEMYSLSKEEKVEGLRLCERYWSLYAAFPTVTDIEYCPKFPGAGFIDACEGDIKLGDCLIEVKTTTKRPAGKDIRQLIAYAALDANACGRRLRRLGIFNPRRGTLHCIELDPLILRLSGGKPSSDVFAELIAFADSNDPALDKKF